MICKRPALFAETRWAVSPPIAWLGVGVLKSSLCGCGVLLQTISVAGAPEGRRVCACAANPSGRLRWEDRRQRLPRRTGSDNLEGNTMVEVTQRYMVLTASLVHTAAGSTG